MVIRFDICTQPNSIKLKLDHIQDVLDSCYETDEDGFEVDNSEWNDDVGLADDYLQDIKMAYSFRVEDTRIVNELQELLGCSADNIIKRVKQLDKALDKACGLAIDNIHSESYIAINKGTREQNEYAKCWKEYLLKGGENCDG